MMELTDWKSALSGLRDSLPEGKPSEETAPTAEEAGKKKEKLCVAMEKKGRGGKTATIIYGFEGTDDEISAVASILRKRLGIGGSSRGGEILLQGDVRDKVKPLLKEMGYRI